jgi:hypothetical protein
MMCLTGGSSIHPASAPRGIEEDIGGSNKADVLCRDLISPKCNGAP